MVEAFGNHAMEAGDFYATNPSQLSLLAERFIRRARRTFTKCAQYHLCDVRRVACSPPSIDRLAGELRGVSNANVNATCLEGHVFDSAKSRQRT
jgi:hypothetical protein